MKKISFVIPCYRSALTIGKVVEEIRESMSGLADRYSYEMILVNDFPADDTFEVIRKLAEEDSRITGVNLARNFGQHAALMAGFHYCSGDIAVCLDDDGQTPADEVGKLLDKLEEGYDVVYAKYNHKQHSAFRNFGSKVNELMTRFMLGKPKDLYISSYFAARKFVIEEMTKYRNSYPYVIGLVLRTTKNVANVEVSHREREIGTSGYTLGKLFGLWFNGFTAFSIKPLRLATACGAFCAFAGFLYGHVDPETQKPGRALWWAAWGCALLSAGQFIVLGCFGSRLSAQLTNPFFNLAKSVGVTGAFQRVESVVAALWMFSDLIQLGVLLYALREIGGRIFPGKEKQAAAAGLVLAAAGGLALVPVEMEPVVLAGNLVFGAGIPVVFGLLKKSPKKLEKRC